MNASNGKASVDVAAEGPESNLLAAWCCEHDGECVQIGASWAQFTGRALHGHADPRWLDAVHPQDREALRRSIGERTSRGEPLEATFRVARADGAWRWAQLRAVPRLEPQAGAPTWTGVLAVLAQDDAVDRQWDVAGRPTCVGIVRDLTARAQATEALEQRVRHSAAVARAAFESREAERKKLAIELIDSIAQELAAGRMLLASTVTRVRDQVTLRTVHTVIEMLQRVLDRLQDRATALRPAALDHFGLSTALSAWCAEQGSGPGTRVSFVCDAAADRLPEPARTVAFRLAQKCILERSELPGTTWVHLGIGCDDAGLVIDERSEGDAVVVGVDRGALHACALATADVLNSYGGTVEVPADVPAGRQRRILRIPFERVAGAQGTAALATSSSAA